MGKVMSLINTTPDGFADGRYTVIDAEYFEFVHSLLAEVNTVIFGRQTFEEFQDRWPPILESEDEPAWRVKMAQVLHDKHKHVYSSTLKTTRWHNSSIVAKLDAERINASKQQGNESLISIGSLALVAALTEMNLVDDYYFCMQPIIAGGGAVRLFDTLSMDACRTLNYVDSTQLKSGVHIIHYQRAAS